MCGRFALFAKGEEVKKQFSLKDVPDIPARYNITPGSLIFAVTESAASNHGHWYKWGLIPSWAKEEKIGYKMINARAETIDEKPSFKRAFRHQRCVIVMNGFFEWHREGEIKQPYYFSKTDGSLLAIAGIWEHWQSPEQESVNSCSIITTSANKLMAPIHDRMPVILTEQAIFDWLDVETTHKELLKPYAEDDLQCYSVTTNMNNAHYQNADAVLEQKS